MAVVGTMLRVAAPRVAIALLRGQWRRPGEFPRAVAVAARRHAHGGGDGTMRAMQLTQVVSVADHDAPLTETRLPIPVPATDEVLLRVRACGVCDTELDEIEGRTPPPVTPVTLGHEVVGTVVEVGSAVTERAVGDRVGVGWIACSDGRENVSDQFVATGRDTDGGYAEYMTARAAYTVPIPDGIPDAEAAPLLCAGAIGYRALRLCNLSDGEPLGLTGFGGSAHIVLQLARHQFPNSRVAVFARDEVGRDFARSMGADWVGHTTDTPPFPLQAVIDTTPAWTPVVAAMSTLGPGGRLVINAIRKEDADKDALLQLNYHDHLWMEKEIKSVANITASDIKEFLPLAAEIPIRTEVTSWPLSRANEALVTLKREPVRGANVLLP